MNPSRTIPAEALPRIGKILLLLTSQHDGEALAAARALARALADIQCDAHDLVRALECGTAPRLRPASWAAPQWQAVARRLLLQHELRLNEREREFLHTMARWSRQPSARQADWLRATIVVVNSPAASPTLPNPASRIIDGEVIAVPQRHTRQGPSD